MDGNLLSDGASSIIPNIFKRILDMFVYALGVQINFEKKSYFGMELIYCHTSKDITNPWIYKHPKLVLL